LFHYSLVLMFSDNLMFNFISSLIFLALFLPQGLNFFSDKMADFSYPQAAVQSPAPQRIANNSLGLKTTAKSILIIDDESGAILYEKNSRASLPIASLTKLMTALVVLDAKPDWEETIAIAKKDQREGNIVYLLPGDEVKIKDVFNLMLVASSNEAAAALARVFSAGRFTALMNQKAEALGLADTYFSDSAGLDPANVSSAKDLVKLAKAAFERPEIISAGEQEIYDFEILNRKREVRAKSTDQLLSSFLNRGDYQIIGAKTGYLADIGYCLLLKIKLAGGQSLTLALLGAKTTLDRWQEAKGLVEWAGRNYVWPDKQDKFSAR